MSEVTRKEFNALKKEVKETGEFVKETLAPLLKKGKLVKCEKCGHPFIYKGKLNQGTCSNCGAKVKIE